MNIVLGGRIPGYRQYASEMSARQYVDKVIDKTLVDPVLTAQLANGFVLKRLLQHYLPSDEESLGWATFLEWSNLDYQPDPNRRLVAARRVRICAVQYQMRRVADFDEFARQCEYFVDVASDYKCDFILFPSRRPRTMVRRRPMAIVWQRRRHQPRACRRLGARSRDRRSRVSTETKPQVER
jgi:hypothetical protein